MNPMRALRFNSKRLRRWAGYATLGLLAVGGMVAAAQEPEAEGLTNDLVSAEVLARLSEMMQSAESAPLEDFNAPEATNGIPEPASVAPDDRRSGQVDRPDGAGRSGSSNRFQNPSRSQNDDSRSRGRRSNRSRSSKSGSQGSTNESPGSDRTPSSPSVPDIGPGGLDYAAFRMVVDRNIFDPNRFPRRPGVASVRPPATRVDTVTLVGTMSYEKGTFAFFDGTSSDYKKALKLSDLIADYRVTNIAPDGVILTAGTNELRMHVGMQLRREENGPWTLGGRSGSFPAVPAPSSTNAAVASAPGSDPASSAAESEIIKKLRQRREQE
jgi:hypothetical protein